MTCFLSCLLSCGAEALVEISSTQKLAFWVLGWPCRRPCPGPDSDAAGPADADATVMIDLFKRRLDDPARAGAAEPEDSSRLDSEIVSGIRLLA